MTPLVIVPIESTPYNQELGVTRVFARKDKAIWKTSNGFAVTLGFGSSAFLKEFPFQTEALAALLDEEYLESQNV